MKPETHRKLAIVVVGTVVIALLAWTFGPWSGAEIDPSSQTPEASEEAPTVDDSAKSAE